MTDATIFSIKDILFTIWGYDLSYVEFIGVTTGLVSLYLATKEKTSNWPLSLISMICFFMIFYQVALYSEMVFQIYFIVIGIYAWMAWHKEDKNNISSITYLKPTTRLMVIAGILLGSFALGTLMIHLYHWWPNTFPQPAAYPFVDAFVAIGSVTAMTLLVKKKIENWLLWMIVNLLSCILYAKQHIDFAALEYALFFVMVTFGFFRWQKSHTSLKIPPNSDLLR